MPVKKRSNVKFYFLVKKEDDSLAVHALDTEESRAWLVSQTVTQKEKQEHCFQFCKESNGALAYGYQKALKMASVWNKVCDAKDRVKAKRAKSFMIAERDANKRNAKNRNSDYDDC